jgi:hypothetical protein
MTTLLRTNDGKIVDDAGSFTNQYGQTYDEVFTHLRDMNTATWNSTPARPTSLLPVQFIKKTLPDFIQSKAYSAHLCSFTQMNVQSYPLTVQVTSGSLPSGMSLEVYTGNDAVANKTAPVFLKGTPTSAGSFSFSVTFSTTNTLATWEDTPYSRTESFTATVSPAVVPVFLATKKPLYEATAGVAVSHVIGEATLDGVAHNHWFFINQSALPPGFALAETTATLTGTFANPGYYSFSAEARCTTTGQKSAPLLWTVKVVSGGVPNPPQPPNTPDPVTVSELMINLMPLSPIVAGVAFSQVIAHSSLSDPGGSLNDVGDFSLVDRGTLPETATLSTDCLLSVTFATAGDYYCTIQVDYDGKSTKRTVYFVVNSGTTAVPTPPPQPPLPPPPPLVMVTTEAQVSGKAIIIKMATDDRQGKLPQTNSSAGTVDYVTGEIYFPVEDFFEAKTWSSSREGGDSTWKSTTIQDSFGAGAKVNILYQPDLYKNTSVTETLPTKPLVLVLTPYTADAIVPGTVRFTIGSTVYEDNEGVIHHTVNPSTGVGTVAGTIDYGSGTVALTNWVAGSATFSVQSLATYRGQFTESEFYFRTAGAPLRPASLQVSTVALDGEQIVGASEVGGDIVGDDVEGTVDVEFGMVNLRYGALVLDDDLTPEEKAEEWYNPANVDGDGYIWKPRKVIPPTTRYNATIYSYLPLSADLLGLSPVRLPVDGRVPFLKPGNTAAVHHTDSFTITGPISGNDPINCGRTRIARFWIYDANGIKVSEAKYSMNLTTGVGSFVPGFTLDSYVLPFTAYHRIVDEVLVTDVDVSGKVTFSPALTHQFPVGSYISSEWNLTNTGSRDLQARVSKVFSLQTWGSWDDPEPESPIVGQFNQALYPIVTTNDGAIQEEWRISFTGATTVNVIGQTVGQINTSGTLSTLTDIAPINPTTSQPYFTIPTEGWGAGWVSGNQLRFTTYAADYPIDLLRCVQAGAAAGDADRLSLEFLGDVDA